MIVRAGQHARRGMIGAGYVLGLWLLAACYPLILNQFHEAVMLSPLLAAFWLILGFSVPALAFVWLLLTTADGAIAASLNAKRFGLAVIAAPTLFVFLGVLNGIAGSGIPDAWLWCSLWTAVALAVVLFPESWPALTPRRLSSWRVAHGVSAALLALYIVFHLANHLAGLAGPEYHKAVMGYGRVVYRAAVIEPLLVLAFLFQVVSGLRLAWHWSAQKADRYRVFQVASGAYLSLFILGHMNSVFVYARTIRGIDTGWSFATGSAAGLLSDPWNIRLVPHYWLGVFLVLGHMAAGLRVVLLGHGVKRSIAAPLFFGGVTASAGVATAILLGMCGVHL